MNKPNVKAIISDKTQFKLKPGLGSGATMKQITVRRIIAIKLSGQARSIHFP